MYNVAILIFVLLNSEVEPHLKGIELQGRTSIDLNSVLAEISIPDTGLILDSDAISSILQKVQNFFWDRGYPFAKAKVLRFDGPSDSLIMVVHIEPGRLVLIQGINVYGLNNTNPDIIFVHLKGLKHSVFNYTKVKKTLAGILKIYPMLSIEKYSISKGDTFIIEFREHSSNSFEIAGGYSKGVGLSGNLTFSSRNVFGTGRKIEIHWERISLQDQTFGFVFQDPTTLVRFVYEVFARYTFRSGLFWQKEFGGQVGPIFSPITLLIGFRQVSSKDLQRQSSSTDYLSTVLLEYKNFEGWQMQADVQIGRMLRIWKLSSGYGLSRISGFKMPIVFNPYLKVFGVFRRDGIKRFDYIEMGGIMGPLGYPPASLYFRDYVAIGMTVFFGKTWYSPFLMGEWAQGNALTGHILTKGIGLGFRQKTRFGTALITYTLKLGNPIDEGLISMSLITNF